MKFFLVFLIAGFALADTAPIADESLRIAALRAIFPGMRIELMQGKRINDSWQENARPSELRAPDAFSQETVYRVMGDAMNQAEKTASTQLATGKISNTRLVRFQVFRWPESTELVAVLQYNFEDATPEWSCPTIGLLVHLANQGGQMEIRDRYLVEPASHYSLKTVRMLNLLGGDVDDLVIESDFGGVDVWGTNFLVFHSGGKLRPIFETTSQVSYKTDDLFTQELDLPATVDRDDGEVCFTKTTTIENGVFFKPARVTRPCYKRVDDPANESANREKMLAPLKP